MTTPTLKNTTHNKRIRNSIKALRQHLPNDIFARNNHAITTHLIGFNPLQNAKHIALYMALKGEVDVSAILQWIHAHTDKHAYLPITHANGTLSFAEITAKSGYIKNQYGILEPDELCPRIDVKSLDIVLTPLVAFNKSKKRLGMGGGYYDRTFAFKQNTQLAPLLIGCAHTLQEDTAFTSESWDIDLDYIVTEESLF